MTTTLTASTISRPNPKNTFTKSRIQSIDLLRGIIMVIMALDHTRDYFHSTALTEDPTNLATTTTLLFFTRWITHLCAPTFVLLSGVSAWLQHGRKTTSELSRFLVTRGLWLVLVDLIVVTFGTTADIHFDFFVIQTLWAIGISMFILGLMIHLPFKVILVTGLLIVLGHNAIDFAERNYRGDVPVWWHFLHKQGDVNLGMGHHLFIFYPFLPWAGLMMMGYCLGKIFTLYPEPQRNKILLRIGIGLLLFFTLLRFVNLYGDPAPWSPQKNSWFTFLSFINITKYPPSLLYLCVTIGPGLIFLSLVKKTSSRLAKIFIVYGRVPMFFYLLHFYLLSGLHVADFLARGHSLQQGMKTIPGELWKFVVYGEGYSIAVVYAIWMAVVAGLYPLCKWYDTYKTSHPEKKWLSYF
ncbi:MAG: heparan-alpha-glucosaminide N-acetyltransferase domain-containing protein [Chitinophagaceae bacterium]